ncbi:MAG TPA: hypothetical protein VGF50_07025 [Caulobacteraceae bacterium]|jgi:hypothetical protein
MTLGDTRRNTIGGSALSLKTASVVVFVCLAAVALGGCKRQAASTNKAAALSAPAAETAGCPEPANGWKGAPSYGPAPSNPDDCFFYTAAWQNFLAATQPDAHADPAFIHYPNIANIFGGLAATRAFTDLKANQLSVAVRDVERPNSLPSHASRLVAVGEGVRQAGGLFGLVVDGAGNPVFYSIHVNDAYAQFIKTNGLTSKAAVEQHTALEFPAGVAEYKAAWAVTADNDPTNVNFITATVDVPVLQQDADGVTRITGRSRMATLKLIAFHVAFVIKDHPEFIWATFEHQDGVDTTDLAPSAAGRDPAAALAVRPGVKYILFGPGASRDSANTPCPGLGQACNPATGHPVLDATTQKFIAGGKVQQTSVFREFPGAKSDRDDEDDSVHAVNVSLRTVLLPQGGPADRRANYRLVGATWLEHPRSTPDRPGDFGLGRPFRNPIGQDTENRSRVVAGEDALASMAMESFTQRDSPNCFSCHDTKAIFSDESGNPVLLKPTLLNVSHVISRFLSNPR